jgi:hypothetical protein
MDLPMVEVGRWYAPGDGQLPDITERIWLGVIERAAGPQGRLAARRGVSEASNSPEDEGADAPSKGKQA